MKKGFGGEVILKDANYEVKDLLSREELATRRRIEHQKKKLIRKNNKREMKKLKAIQRQQTIGLNALEKSFKGSSKNLLETNAQDHKKIQVVNPIFMILFMGMSIKAWRNFAKLKSEGQLDQNDEIIRKSGRVCFSYMKEGLFFV